MIDTRYPPAAQCPGIGMLTLRVLDDLQRWTAAELPGHLDLPLAFVALGEAVIHPWALPGQLRLSGRMGAWVCAADDHVERDVTELAELDEFIDRCDTVVRTGRQDDSRPLLASLSRWQRELADEPLYPKLADLWERKFAACLRAMRYDWLVGSARADGTGTAATVDEYLDNADSISVWQVHLPRWISSGRADLVDHLDVLVPALDDIAVVGRLANDLAGYSRERTQPRENNVLMYGVSPEWVRTEIDSRLGAVRRRLADLVVRDHPPAVGLVRLAEWTVGIYAHTDPRVPAAGPPYDLSGA
ncbi:MAG TPA: terpene synthase family protein [Pseudonocardiaceae bacterium]|nr:terpene synthase family protein [Pseudonocardiaceae bacterium]